MRTPLPACLALAYLPLAAQAPVEGGEAYFKGEPRTIMVACAEKAFRAEGKEPDMVACLGRAYLVAGEEAKALALFQKAMAEAPKDMDLRRAILEVWLGLGLKHQAQALAEGVLQARSKKAGDLSDMAVLLMDAGMPAEAEALMGASWEANSLAWDHALAFARACLRAGRRDAAAPWLQRTVAAKPNEEKAWREIASALAHNGLED